MYDPTVGRWLSADPIGFAAGDVNLYRYVGNVVVRFVDPRGLQPPATIQSPVEPSRPISDIINPGIDWPSIIANPGGFFPPIIINPGQAIDDWWEDIKDKADGYYDDIINGIEDDWVEHAPGWDYSNDIEFLYALCPSGKRA